MRRRMIDPSLWGDPDVQRLDAQTFKLFLAHISAADDEGRGDLTADDFKLMAFPFVAAVDEDAVEAMVKTLSKPKRKKDDPLVLYYEVDGTMFWVLLKWDKYPTINRPTASRIPPHSKAKKKKSTRGGTKVTPDQLDLLRTLSTERGIDLDEYLAAVGYAGPVEGLLSRQASLHIQKIQMTLVHFLTFVHFVNIGKYIFLYLSGASCS